MAIGCGAVACGHPEAFLTPFNHFKPQLTVKDLNAIAQNGEDKGKSIWWLLAHAAAYGYPVAFSLIFNHFKDQLTVKHLNAMPQDEAAKGMSVLWLLALSLDVSLVKELLTQISGNFDELDLDIRPVMQNNKTLRELLKEAPYSAHKLLPLIEAKKAFWQILQKINCTSLLCTDEDFTYLEEKAQAAADNGYVNIYYDLGELYIQHNDPIQAAKCYDCMPANSWYNRQIENRRAEIAEFYFSQATQENITLEEKKAHFRNALHQGFQAPPDTCNSLIKRIALLYIYANPKLTTTLPSELENLLPLITNQKSADVCFTILDLLKEKVIHAQQIKELLQQLTTLNNKKRKASIFREKDSQEKDNLTSVPTLLLSKHTPSARLNHKNSNPLSANNLHKSW